MNNQDPVREYIINEILKNIIYIDLVKKKDKLINIKKNKKLTTEELNNLQNKIDIINNDIDLISTNKNKKYNQLIYRRFINNYNLIKKKIIKKDEKYEELIKTYQLLINNNYINPNKKIKHLKI